MPEGLAFASALIAQYLCSCWREQHSLYLLLLVRSVSAAFLFMVQWMAVGPFKSTDTVAATGSHPIKAGVDILPRLM